MGGPVRVLAIDDEPAIRALFAQILSLDGFEVIEAGGGRSGLDAFPKVRPDVVLLDLRMPDMDGLEVLSSLNQQAPTTPVVVVSGQGTMTDVVQALRSGAWDFLAKPIFDAELLVQTVRRVLEKAALIDQNRRFSEELRKTNAALWRALADLRADQEAARHLQFQLLPPDDVQMGSFRFERRLFPSRTLSGDFIDYFQLGDDLVAFYLADVAGRGAASALVTAVLYTLIGKYREAFTAGRDEVTAHPAKLLERLNRDLLMQKVGHQITMFYGVLNSRSGDLVYSSTGQNPLPLALVAGEARSLDCPGTPLGLKPDATFKQYGLSLRGAGRVLCVSDGVLELPPVQAAGERQSELMQLVAGASSIDEVAATLSLGRHELLKDDVAMLFIRETGAV